MMQSSSDRFRVLFSGILSLILTLGISRFAYTPMLPIMQHETWLTDASGGWLATWNYMGYMCGAVIAAMVSDLRLKDRLYRAGLILAVLSTLGMAFTESMFWWAVLRYLGGLTSAAGLLIGSGLILNWLYRNDHKSELGIHFSGIGGGIAFASLVVLLLNISLDWRELWIALGLIGLVLAIPAWLWLPPPDSGAMTSSGQALKDNPPTSRFMWLMMMAYFCAGVGYVVSATFIVAIIEKQPAMQGQGELVFLVIGLAGAPACIAWDYIARRTGVMTALLIAYAAMIVGIILPVFSDHLGWVMLSSILYGFTMVGIVSLVLTMAGRFYPTKPAKLMGRLTLSYGLAQVIAPALSGQIAEATGSYNIPLYLASGISLLGMVVIMMLRTDEKAAKVCGG